MLSPAIAPGTKALTILLISSSLDLDRLLSAVPFHLDPVEKGALKRRHEFSGAVAFDDLSVCELVTQSLSLRIARHRDGFERDRDHVQSRHNENEISLRRLQAPAGAAVAEIDHAQTEQKLADALPRNEERIPQQHIRRGDGDEEDRILRCRQEAEDEQQHP